MTYDEFGNGRPTHERLIKTQRSTLKLIKEGTLFTYLDEELIEEIGRIPATTNQIEGGVNARLREMLRSHGGLSIERRIKATRQEKLSDSIPGWGDAIVWTEFHRSGDYPSYWD